jgi:hypothetical protein
MSKDNLFQRSKQRIFSLLRDPAKGEPLEIHKLMARAVESAPG